MSKYIYKTHHEYMSEDKQRKIIVWYYIPQGRGRKRQLSFDFFNNQKEADCFIEQLKRG